MKNFFKRNWKALLIFFCFGLVGGFCTSLYSLDVVSAELKQQVLSKGLSETLLSVISGIQVAVIYGLILGSIGIFFSEKIGLWKNEWDITKKPFVVSLCVSVIGGLFMILLDMFWFGKYSSSIMDLYVGKPTISFMVSCLTYGAVIEEVMMRLFLMSVISFIVHKLCEQKRQKVSVWVFVLSNIITAVLFAAGHLPATFSTIGNSPIILFRCFLLNGGIGLLFGYLYRKYGLRYAMIAHGGCHIISKLIWILFL